MISLDSCSSRFHAAGVLAVPGPGRELSRVGQWDRLEVVTCQQLHPHTNPGTTRQALRFLLSHHLSLQRSAAPRNQPDKFESSMENSTVLLPRTESETVHRLNCNGAVGQ